MGSTVFALLSLPHESYAQVGRFATIHPTRAAIREEIKEKLQEKKFEIQEKRQTLKKERSYQEIDRRINGLNKLIEHINAMKHITESQKSNLTSQVQAEIDSLKTLRAKIEGDTDLATLTADKQSIITSHRVYALFLPKIQIMSHADRILTVADEMKAKTSNSEALKKIEEGKTLSQKAIDTVISLKPEGYPGNKTDLKQGRDYIQQALKALNDARLLMGVSSSSSSNSSK